MTDAPLHWHPAAAAPAIAPGELHLWHLHADGRGDDLESALALLGERQRRRALGMTHQGYRERYIRAQAGLRRVLGLYLGLPPQALGFTYGPAGKPAAAQALGVLEFNLTTTADLALVALSRGGEVGIDCEWLRPRRDLEAIARRMFSPAQVRALLATPQAERLAFFYRAWTALEADAKADGRGLFRPREPGAQVPQVIHCIPAPGHIAAVARARLPPREQWLTLELMPLAGGLAEESKS
ncbi:4'-phosphopantetheinyl transferase superfamily protein [uncultured Thiodictyon sp.]|jgi:4'-phosphopantetheinyl transferase|uniref:4'-phosphopantetheinyl transferase family protein n=1 Tax=uncultured Thiodictyon sp. TaxID=1846217 RepID=UPI0025E5C2E1|nr:4'-phosphopantetheinyl transferase superfamily protein [uncultured Thiodictyon sp.]